MADAFDPYSQWLGITDPQRPPNHYQLLGLQLFESDTKVIEQAADDRMGLVRTYQTGRWSTESQQLLNELAFAKLCLIDPRKRERYDQQLRVATAATSGDLFPPALGGSLPPPAMPPVLEPSSLTPNPSSSGISVPIENHTGSYHVSASSPPAVSQYHPGSSSSVKKAGSIAQAGWWPQLAKSVEENSGLLLVVLGLVVSLLLVWQSGVFRPNSVPQESSNGEGGRSAGLTQSPATPRERGIALQLEPAGQLAGHTAAVWFLLPVGEQPRLITASTDRSIRLWDLTERRFLREVTKYGNLIQALAISGDGQYLASCSADNEGHIWNLNRLEPVTQIFGDLTEIRVLVFSRDGKRLFGGLSSGQIKVWGGRSGVEIHTFPAHQGPVTALASLGSGRLLSAGADGRLLLSTATRKTQLGKNVTSWQAEPPSSGASMTTIVASRDGRRVLSGSADGSLHWWDATSGQVIRKLQNGSGVTNVALSADGQLGLSGGDDGRVRLWDLRAGSLMAVSPGEPESSAKPGRILQVAFSPNQRIGLSCSVGPKVQLWSLPRFHENQLPNQKETDH